MLALVKGHKWARGTSNTVFPLYIMEYAQVWRN